MKVAVFGGGVAGLSAAHELISRGFEVEIYEAAAVAGGKARSMGVPGSGKDGRKDLPGEHGFRFFPRFFLIMLINNMREPGIGYLATWGRTLGSLFCGVMCIMHWSDNLWIPSMMVVYMIIDIYYLFLATKNLKTNGFHW